MRTNKRKCFWQLRGLSKGVPGFFYFLSSSFFLPFGVRLSVWHVFCISFNDKPAGSFLIFAEQKGQANLSSFTFFCLSSLRRKIPARIYQRRKSRLAKG